MPTPQHVQPPAQVTEHAKAVPQLEPTTFDELVAAYLRVTKQLADTIVENDTKADWVKRVYGQ